MSSSMIIRSIGQTDVGKKRTHNEDSYFSSDELGLYIVADGMGGHAAGEVASAKAVEVIKDFVERCRQDSEFTWPYGINPELGDLENTLVTAIKLANREVWRLAQEKPDHHGMGTTIAATHISGNQMAIAHVGDSRVYLMRGGKLILKTRDHSWVNEQLARGIITQEEAKTHRWKNVITRALGNKEQIEVEVSHFEIEPDDVFLICSDGLCAGDGVEEDEILEKMLENQSDLRQAGLLLIGLANDIGGKDNITVVLTKAFQSEEEAENATRDNSNEDTNPIAISSIPPPGLDMDNTAEIEALSDSEATPENQMDEPIEFDEDETPNILAQEQDTEPAPDSDPKPDPDSDDSTEEEEEEINIFEMDTVGIGDDAENDDEDEIDQDQMSTDPGVNDSNDSELDEVFEEDEKK